MKAVHSVTNQHRRTLSSKAGNLYKYKIHSDIFKTVFTKDANQDFLKNP